MCAQLPWENIDVNTLSGHASPWFAQSPSTSHGMKPSW